MKYEKFEDWMVGQKVVLGDNGCTLDTGVVLGVYGHANNSVYVKWDSDGTDNWINLSKVSFEKDMSNETAETGLECSKIDWQVGQEVWDVCYGEGKVIEIDEGDYPIIVQFSLDEVMSYTLQGKVHKDYNRTLFFSEPTVIADTMPPKKVFKPTLKEGDEVVVRTVSGGISAHTVEKECEEYIKFKDEDFVLYKKRIVSINKIGEQLKVDCVK